MSKKTPAPRQVKSGPVNLPGEYQNIIATGLNFPCVAKDWKARLSALQPMVGALFRKPPPLKVLAHLSIEQKILRTEAFD